MKFQCDDCRRTMEFVDNQTDDELGVMSVQYQCPNCGRRISMVTNPGETQLVHSLGVTIGHETLSPSPASPMSMVRGALESAAAVDEAAGPEPVWTEAAERRLATAPSFVQGMVRKLYSDWARQQGYREVTPSVMSEAREALGMSGM